MPPDLSERNKRMAELYADGMTLAQIADQVGLSVAGVRKAIAPLCQIRPKGSGRSGSKGPRKPVSEDVIRIWKELYQAGLSVPDIAHQYGIQTSRVYSILRKHCEMRTPMQTNHPHKLRQPKLD